MAGDRCVAIGSDLRFGVQMQTMATDYQKVLQVRIHIFHHSNVIHHDTAYVFQESRSQVRHLGPAVGMHTSSELMCTGKTRTLEQHVVMHSP
jgi:hypothetical protein